MTNSKWAYRKGLLAITKRLTIPCVHPDQLKQAVKVLRELADEIDTTLKKKEPSNFEKCAISQQYIVMAHHRLQRQWANPRLYKSEKLEYTKNDGLVNIQGLDELDTMYDEHERKGGVLSD